MGRTPDVKQSRYGKMKATAAAALEKLFLESPPVMMAMQTAQLVEESMTDQRRPLRSV